jgi:hypothetical protein
VLDAEPGGLEPRNETGARVAAMMSKRAIQHARAR